jgi:putative membrane protein
MVASTLIKRLPASSAASVLIVAVGLAGCRERADRIEKTRTTSIEVPVNGQPAPPPPRASINELDDAQVLGVLRAADGGELMESQVAVARASDPRVRDLAQQMLVDHRNSDALLADLGSREGIIMSESPTSESVRAIDQATLEDIQGRTGADFDRAYLDAQVRDHEVFLATIDNTLLRSATNNRLKQQLTTIRDRTAEHARKARALREDFIKSQQP